MGDESTPLSDADARHLLRRTGFGAAPEDVAILSGMTRGDAVDQLLAFTPNRFRPGGRYIDLVHNKWVKYMVRVKAKMPPGNQLGEAAGGLQEKLVIFWHDHFATGNDKVGYPKIMSNQNRLLRELCKSNFKDFVKAINKDAAMMEYLDTVRNHRFKPNENYGRELQELFTLGVKDFAGNENYSQEDIVQIARAFTGWDYNYKNGQAEFDSDDHNTIADGGAKIIYSNHGNLGGVDYTQAFGEGSQEIDAVIDIIFQHTDSAVKSTVARFITKKLFSYFAYEDPDPIIIDALIEELPRFDTTWEISQLLRRIFVHDAFYETSAPATPPYTGNTKKSVKWPVDYVVSTLRLLDMRLKGKYQYVNGGTYEAIRTQLTNMGQILLDPPSVFGWDWELAWLSSSSLLARYGFANDVVSARYGGGKTVFRPERFVVPGSPTNQLLISLTDAGQIVDAVADILGITDQLTSDNDPLTPDDRSTLIDYLTDGNPGAGVNLNNYDVRNTKLHGLFAMILQSPAYQLH